MEKIVSNNNSRLLMIIVALLWIPLFGLGVVASIISKELPQVIIFPIVWIIMICIFVWLFIITSRVVTIREGAISYKVFKNETVIPFDKIKSISGGVRRIPNIPVDIFISIVFEDDSLHIKTIKFLPKSDGYKWNKEHEVVDELRHHIHKFTTKA